MYDHYVLSKVKNSTKLDHGWPIYKYKKIFSQHGNSLNKQLALEIKDLLHHCYFQLTFDHVQHNTFFHNIFLSVFVTEFGHSLSFNFLIVNQRKS